MKNKKGVKDFYQLYINKIYCRPVSQQKWESKLNFIHDEKWWENKYKMIFKLTQDVKIRWFNYRIIHRLLATNEYLHKIGIEDSSTCDFCNDDIENLQHVFWECNLVKPIWVELCNWVNQELDLNISLTLEDVLFGSDIEKELNNVISLFKSFIYSSKIKQTIPSFRGAKMYFLNYKKIDKFIFKGKSKLKTFEKKWGVFYNL